MTKLVHWTLTSQSTKQVTCFELVMKRDHFIWSSSAKGKIAPAVLLMRQNKHYAAKQTLLNLLANLTPREKCYEKHSASDEGVQIAIAVRRWKFGIAVQHRCGQGNVRHMRCAQRTEAADAVRTAGTNFLSAPSLKRMFWF